MIAVQPGPVLRFNLSNGFAMKVGFKHDFFGECRGVAKYLHQTTYNMMGRIDLVIVENDLVGIFGAHACERFPCIDVCCPVRTGRKI